jgi:hypothetical protein
MSAIAPKIILSAAKSMVILPQTRNDTFNWQLKSAFGVVSRIVVL